MKKTTYVALAAAVLVSVAEARTVELKTGRDQCRVDLTGGRIVSYAQDGQELLWNDTPAQTTAKDWAHGGIPICWPWFGDDGKGNLHGVAWRRAFREGKKWTTDGVCGQEISLREGDLELVYNVILRDGLTLEANVKNCGATNCSFTIAFHPYFRAEERDRVSVLGVDGRPFEDDPSFPNPQKGVWTGIVRVTNYVDRIFAFPEGKQRFRVDGVRRGQSLALECEGFTGLNVWNPSAEKNCAGVLPGDCWRRFVCVEPVRCSPAGTVVLAPGAKRTFRFAIRPVATKRAAVREPVNVLDFGADPEGLVDSTAAFQKAIDSLEGRGGRVEAPAGNYLVGELKMRTGVTLQGAPGYSFQHTSFGTVLRLRCDKTSKALINFTGSLASSVRDLALVGDLAPDGFGRVPGRVVHGIGLLKPNSGWHEDYHLVDRVLVRNFSGDGICLDNVFCGNVRNTLIVSNGGDGIRLRGWDVFVINNEIINNGGYGFHGVPPNNACTITANRIEWNHSGGIFLDEGTHYCLNANYVDRSGSAAVILDNSRFVTFTGNQLYRSARPEWARKDFPYSAHAVLRNCKGVTFSSNSLVLGRDDDGHGKFSPKSGIVMTNLVECAVIGNTGYASVLEKFLDDRGGHVNTIIRDNAGSAMTNINQVLFTLPDHGD